MKKIVIILALLATMCLYSQHKIQIIGVDDSVNEYSVEDITNITFEFESRTLAIVMTSDNEMAEMELDNESSITFDSENITLMGVNSSEKFELSKLTSIEFEEISIENKYPFGELTVDEIIVDNLINPWGIDFLDKDNLIFTEISGRLYKHNLKNGKSVSITGLPKIKSVGQGGLLDVTLHPDFDENGFVYLAYTVEKDNRYTTAIGRGKLVGDELIDFEELFRGSPLLEGGNHFGSRIVFDNDNMLYFSIGERGRQENAQDSTNHLGGVLRLHDDGRIPNDNPYLDAPGAQPEIYTMGNRNIQGMFYLSERDEIWAIEHGPKGGDELNLIEGGENYGWPLATFGINYNDTPITDKTSIPGYKDPITYWVPSIAPCGMDMINYDEAKNEIDIIIGTLWSSHLHRIKVKDYKVTETVRSLEGYARFRDVQMSPDGYLYAATQNPGRIIRLKTKN